MDIDALTTYPQCRPITSMTKHLWWLATETDRYW